MDFKGKRNRGRACGREVHEVVCFNELEFHIDIGGISHLAKCLIYSCVYVHIYIPYMTDGDIYLPNLALYTTRCSCSCTLGLILIDMTHIYLLCLQNPVP